MRRRRLRRWLLNDGTGKERKRAETGKGMKAKPKDRDKLNLGPSALIYFAKVLISTVLLHSLAQTKVQSTRALLSESDPALSKPKPEDQLFEPALPKKKEKINHHQLASRNVLPFLPTKVVTKKRQRRCRRSGKGRMTDADTDEND